MSKIFSQVEQLFPSNISEKPLSEKVESLGFTNKRENNTWLQFERGDNSRLHEALNAQMQYENDLLEGYSNGMPKNVEGLFKIGLLVKPDEYDDVLDLLANKTQGSNLLVKFRQPNAVKNDSIPNVVIYTYDKKVGYVLEAAESMALALEEELGESSFPQRSPFTRYINTRVSIMQGNFGSKAALKRENPDLFASVYEAEGVFYKSNERRVNEKLIRSKNQLKFNEGYPHLDHFGEPILTKLQAYQELVLEGLDMEEDFVLGERIYEVKIGGRDGTFSELLDKLKNNPRYELQDFYPPTAELSRRIVANISNFYESYKQKGFINNDEDALERLCGVLEIGLFATHPLGDGNGQTIRNIISSVLFEHGKDNFIIQTPIGEIDNSLGGTLSVVQLRSKTPTLRMAIPGVRSEEEALMETAKAAVEFKRASNEEVLEWFFNTPEGLSYLDTYIKTGKFVSESNLSIQSINMLTNIRLYSQAFSTAKQALHSSRRVNTLGEAEKIPFSVLQEKVEKAA